MNEDVMVFLDRKELEFLKNQTVEVATGDTPLDREWVIKLAAKLIAICEKEDEVNAAV